MLDFLLLTAAELLADSGIHSAFAIAAAIIALTYMAGEFFSMASLRAFSKGELYELGVSMVILLIAAALITPGGPFDLAAQAFLHNPSGNPLGPSDVCPEWEARHPYRQNPLTMQMEFTGGNLAFGQADYFLGCRPGFEQLLSLNIIPVGGIMLDKITFAYSSLMATEMMIGFLSGIGTNLAITVVPAPPLKVDVGIMPFIGLGQINDIHTLIVDFMGTLFSAYAGQKMLLIFIEEAAIPVFLPFGMLLRAFPFTRKTGSTVVAVVFAAYFVYPVSILINQQMWFMITAPGGPGGCAPNWEYCDDDGDCCANNCVANACVPTVAEPGCETNFVPCTANDECCSGNCRADECRPAITDFSEYSSIYAICYDKSESEIEAKIEAEAEGYSDSLYDTYFSPINPSDDKWTKTKARLGDYQTELERKISAMGLIMVPGEGLAGKMENIVLPNPGRVIPSAFNEVETLVIDAAQFGVLTLLFIVVEIVITLTLMKDFALLIGGEPRVLGMTKLV